MESKGIIIGGEFGKVLARERSSNRFSIGELVVCEQEGRKILLQVVDLLYGSQISQQNLELISGMKLEEEEEVSFHDPHLRNYTLAVLKNMITISGSGAYSSKSLPGFFSSIREVTKEDLRFISVPPNPLFLGHLRSGREKLGVPIALDGEKVFSHHILIPAATGKGKSLDGEEEVLIKKNGEFLIKPIEEIVNHSKNFRGSSVVSMNPKNFSTDLKQITKFVRHKAPKFMYKVVTDSGREIIVTGDHNLHVLRNGCLQLLKTQEILNSDHVPLPVKLNANGSQKTLNLFELLKHYKGIYVLYNHRLIKYLRPKEECLKILKRYLKKPKQKYVDFIVKKNKIRISLLKELLQKKITEEDLKSIELTDLHQSLKLEAVYPLTKDFLQLIGYYIAEGYCLNENSFRISCSDKEGRNLLERIFKNLDLQYFWIKKRGRNVDAGVSSSIFTKVLRQLDLGRISEEKRLPNFFMNLTNENLRILLKTYFEGDGGVDKKRIPEKKYFKISATTKSKKLANDLCIALYRFGIFARCKKTWKKAANTNHKGNWYYRVSISGKSGLVTFLSNIGFQFSRKNNILKGLLDYKENRNVDVVPINPEEFKKRREQTKLSQTKFASELECSRQLISLFESGKRRPSRDLFQKMLTRFNAFKQLSFLLHFRWDKIKEIKKIPYNKEYVYDLTVKDNKTFLAGHGGLFVHNSNLCSVMLWETLDKDYCGVLVLDPHDEYYGRNSVGLKDHVCRDKVVYYTPSSPPPGSRTLKINISVLKPSHFNGVLDWSGPQKEALSSYYRKYKKDWIESIVLERPVEGFHEGTLHVIRRRICGVLGIDVVDGNPVYRGVFDGISGETTVKDIVHELEMSKTVVVDTSYCSGALEILIGSVIVKEVFSKYKYYKACGELNSKPVVSIVLEEAPRVLGKDVLEKGPNIFSTIAREGRKFKVGLTAITQLPSLIPRDILANMNTKIILGVEMKHERQALIESAAQDLSDDDRNIASLDKGEAIITSNFSRFATPIKVPYFPELVKVKKEEVKREFTGMG